MTDIKKRKLKRIIFPIGVFFLLFLTVSIIGIAGVASYIYLSGKKNIEDIETYTVNYSKTMAEAFARVAELEYPGKKYTALKALFREKIEDNTIDEAFFVLKNRKIVVHSSIETEKKLKGNIGSDEISYNIDMILQPVYTKSHELIFFKNYNITDKFIPFRKWERDLLSKYIYEDLNTTGWLFTKCIFHKQEPIGTVNFIISKERIYSSIRQSIDMVKLCSIFIIAVSALISFLVSLIVFFRYRSIQLNALQHDNFEYDSAEYDSTEYDSTGQDYPIESAQDYEGAELYKDYSETFIEDYSETLKEDFDDYDMTDHQESDFLDMADNEVEKLPMERIRIIEDLTEVNEPKRTYDQTDDEYMTVEFLGEIEPVKKPPVVEKKRPVKHKEYIAPVFNINDYKKSMNREIRDAIPVRKKR